MESLERITIDPNICHGRPTIRGLRYTVEMVLELLSSGMTAEEILSDYEDLEREDILAVLAYAARLTRVKRIEPAAAGISFSTRNCPAGSRFASVSSDTTQSTLDLPRANKTTDDEINEISVRELRVVVTKGSDFVDSLLLRGQPWKLLLVTTGNIRNSALEELFLANLDTVHDALAKHDYVELNRSAVVLHF